MEAPSPPPEGNVNKAPVMIIAGSITVALATLFVLLRFIVRTWITKAVGWDDWTILFAAIGNIIGLGLDYVEFHYGFGRPQVYLNEHQLLEFGKYTHYQETRLVSLASRANRLHTKLTAGLDGGIDNWFWRLSVLDPEENECHLSFRSFEIQIGIMAACAPALLPGYKWLDSLVRDLIAFRSRSKPSDNLHLRSVERKVPEERIGNGSFRRLGNDTSIDTKWDPPAVSANQITKTINYEVEHT
ncbi:MAG: hypothetical protein Q9201_005402 [Fulgogasparrea decipioides]